MKGLRDFFAEETIRLEEMVHFPLSGGDGNVPASDRLKELLIYEGVDALPAEVRAALGDGEDLDGMDEDEIGERLNGAVEGWLVQLATPIRSYLPGDNGYGYSWNRYTCKWFFCPGDESLLPQAKAWIEDLDTKWRAEK